MKKLFYNKKILGGVLAIVVALGLAGAGTMAYFNDTETSKGNTITAGTLDLKVDGGDDPIEQKIELSNIAPGWDSSMDPNVSCVDSHGKGWYKWTLTNVGNLPGKVSVTFSEIVNLEGEVTEPEALVDNTTGENEGELGQYLKPGIHPDDIPADVMKHVTIVERNDEEGWFIAEVSEDVDTGGTIGWGSKGSGCPSRLHSIWQTGPPHPWGTPGLNGLGGNTYGTLKYLPGDVLNPGQEVAFFFRVNLDDNLRTWTGTEWIDVADDIIQSDYVEFEITFELEQDH